MSSGCRWFWRRIPHRRSGARSAGRNTGTFVARGSGRADGSCVNLEYGAGSFSTRDSPAAAITDGGAVGAGGGLAALAAGCSRTGGGAVGAGGGGLAVLARG